MDHPFFWYNKTTVISFVLYFILFSNPSYLHTSLNFKLRDLSSILIYLTHNKIKVVNTYETHNKIKINK